ncbi:MAG: deoxyribodipyrimidine photo-lyase [Bdellovibrionales bacterium]|nr:deoxyribodipyrimidine photo-lyase [Bdellovibrionales bacterium]
MEIKDYGIHWFRRDLKISGNLALSNNLRTHEGRVLGLFCFDHLFLGRPDFSINRFQFFLETLSDLKAELQKQGGDLLVLDVGPKSAYENILGLLTEHQIPHPHTVSWNRDYEPFATKRDAEMLKWFQEKGVRVVTERDHLLIEPHEIFKGDDPNAHYQVFTPFKRRWIEKFKTEEIQKRLIVPPAIRFQFNWSTLFSGKIVLKDHLELFLESNKKKVTIPIPLAGELEGKKLIALFLPKVKDYGVNRDIPSLEGTSRFSMFYKNGSLTTSQVIREMKLSHTAEWNEGEEKFVSELIWREFYYYILERFPRVENEAFLEKYKKIKWGNNKKWFQAWKDGQTGFPIVDAGMRQLNETGWMHNRVRMIVASFLTKDLHVDWRWGQKYFMEKLLDGDLAPNNGGWQWAASTGCDPQPYFRIFNPYLQSKRFDPEGVYLKKYLPELRDLTSKWIHEPPQNLMTHGYPAPIVDHSIQRLEAMALYKGN